MNKIFLALFLLPFFGIAQLQKISGVVYDKNSKETLPFVNITVNKSKMGTAADIDGKFDFSVNEPVSNIKLSYIGYEPLEMEITSQTKFPLEIYLKESKDELDQIELVAGENPAHEIIRKASANRKINNPEGLETFAYTSYNKFIVTFQMDSTVGLIDTNWVNENTDSASMDIDSSNYDARQFIDSQHLFMLESVSDRKYSSSPRRNNEKVVASRVSGFKNPTFTLLATQMQSFSFYNDFITVLDKDYINPISGGSTNRYIFIIQDTVISSFDSTFVISYQPKLNSKFDGLTGVLYITSDGWALKNILAKPQDQEGLGIEIQSKSEKIGGVWFPTQMTYDFRFYSTEDLDFGGFEPLGIGRTYVSKIKLEEEYKRKDFSRLEVQITDEAGKQPEEFWNQYRVDPLDSQELKTYHVIDSIGDAENFELKLGALQALLSGKFRYKFLDFDLDKVIGYNIYEGFRIGVGAHTNFRMLNCLRLGGYVGYGFKDQVFKYNYEADLILNERLGLILNGGYVFDIEETGSQTFNMAKRTNSLLATDLRNLNRQQFDEVSKVYVNLSWNILPNLHSRVFANRQNRQLQGTDYRFLQEDAGGDLLVNGFNSTQAGIALRYAPKDKYMEGPFGRKPIDLSHPVYEIQYTRGISDVWESGYTFNKIDARINYKFKTKRFGVTKVQLAGGYVDEDLPYSFLYTPIANRPTNVNWPIYAAGMFAFETMYNNEFISNAWAHVIFIQNFKGYLLKIGDWNPDVEFVMSAIVGSLNNPDLQKNIDFKTLEKGFYETGFEINKMWQSIGVGVYYRFGPYYLPEIQDNFSVKVTARINLF
jgi:hypothetical protein